MEEDGAGGNDNVVTEFNTYEDFLDAQITPLDLYYLEVWIWCNIVYIHTFRALNIYQGC